jgi:hypothetical protein
MREEGVEMTDDFHAADVLGRWLKAPTTSPVTHKKSRHNKDELLI